MTMSLSDHSDLCGHSSRSLHHSSDCSLAQNTDQALQGHSTALRLRWPESLRFRVLPLAFPFRALVLPSWLPPFSLRCLPVETTTSVLLPSGVPSASTGVTTTFSGTGGL